MHSGDFAIAGRSTKKRPQFFSIYSEKRFFFLVRDGVSKQSHLKEFNKFFISSFLFSAFIKKLDYAYYFFFQVLNLITFFRMPSGSSFNQYFYFNKSFKFNHFTTRRL
jgi:hypothetical protein